MRYETFAINIIVEQKYLGKPNNLLVVFENK